MANVQRVINLISNDDKNIKFSCFNDSSDVNNDEELYSSWISFIQSHLGDCCFNKEICALIMYSEAGETIPRPVKSTEDVLELIMSGFDTPETFRLELVTQYNTTFTWLFVLTSDLQL